MAITVRVGLEQQAIASIDRARNCLVEAIKRFQKQGSDLSQSEEPAKASTCAHDRHALQQLALNVHVKTLTLTLRLKIV